MKNITLYILSMAFFIALPAQGHAKYNGEDPEKLMTVKDIEMMGIKLTMTMGEILQKLRAQGYTPTCKGTSCVARGSDIHITVTHAARSLGKHMQDRPIDENALPIEIGIGNVSNFSYCGISKKIIAEYCNKDDQKQPCFTDNFGRTTGNFGASKRSSDGYTYSATVYLIPDKTCSASFKRIK